MSEYVDTARRVIRTEAQGLEALETALDNGLAQPFQDAVRLILQATGRVVVSGMGKSGHVGRKIAATLASTGTPAHFGPRAAPSRGGGGLVPRGVVHLVLPNGGGTPECADISPHPRRFAIPLIGIAGREGSTLLRQSDVALLLPQAAEACGTGIVPTTSTTMTLALGDALAVALMEHRRFTPEHFRTFHPGGKLGARLARVQDLMHDDMPLVGMDAPMTDTLLEITRKGFGVTGVTDDAGRLVGIITDGDLRRHMQGLLDRRAGEVMTRNPRSIAPEALAEAALAEMQGSKITSLFAVRDGLPQGILHIHDCLRAGMV